jgi:hypothetical protein
VERYLEKIQKECDNRVSFLLMDIEDKRIFKTENYFSST